MPAKIRILTKVLFSDYIIPSCKVLRNGVGLLNYNDREVHIPNRLSSP
jgi:hypothetical protein